MNFPKAELSHCFFISLSFNLLHFLNFQVSGLNSGRGLKITIYAANANGRSPNIVLEGFTLKVAELQVGKPHFFHLFLQKMPRNSGRDASKSK